MMNLLWPSIDDMEDAQKASKTGAGCAFFVAGATGLITFLFMQGIKIIPGWSVANFLDAAIFGVLGIFMLRYSRLAALAALILYVAGQILIMRQTGPRFNLLAIFFTLYFISAVRGTFAYHEMKKQAEETEGKPASGNPVLKILGAIIGLAVLGGAGWMLYPRLMAAKPGAKTIPVHGRAKSQNRPFQLPNISIPNILPQKKTSGASSAPTSSAPLPGQQTFKLKNGKTVTGHVTHEDDVYYTIETFGGHEEIVIKEDIAS